MIDLRENKRETTTRIRLSKKMEQLKKAEKVKFAFEKMDKETQEAVKSLINHLMVAKTKKEHEIE